MQGFTLWKQSLCELVSTQTEKTNETAVLWKTLDKKWHFRWGFVVSYKSGHAYTHTHTESNAFLINCFQSPQLKLFSAYLKVATLI